MDTSLITQETLLFHTYVMIAKLMYFTHNGNVLRVFFLSAVLLMRKVIGVCF